MRALRSRHRNTMSLETASYIHQLDVANPSGTDRLAQGDDHLRLIKRVLLSTFPNITGPVTVSQDFLNTIAGSLIPVGLMGIWGLATAPPGWAICDGRTVNRSDGSGQITTPDLRGRVLAQANTAHPLGTTWGQESITVTSAVAGAHNHSLTLTAAGSHRHGGVTGSTALTLNQMPAHSHYSFANVLTGYDNLQNFPEGAPSRGGSGGSSGASYNMGSNGSAATIGRTSSSGAGAGHTHTIGEDGGHTHAATLSAAAGHSHAVTVAVSQPSAAVHFIMKV